MSATQRTAVVTGASSGIGAVYADRLAARGHDLVLVARRRDRLTALAAKLRTNHGGRIELAIADLADETDLKQVEAIVRDTPDLAVLANCAGLGALGLSTAVDPTTVDALIRVNVLALTRLSLEAARRFSVAKQGTIINIGSIIGLTPRSGGGAYSGSKAYVLNFSRSLQAELADSDVTVHVVMPGPVRTEFFGDKPAPFPDELFMTPEAVVDAALAALDQGETVTFPNLHDITPWQQLEVARATLLEGLRRDNLPAARYIKHASMVAA